MWVPVLESAEPAKVEVVQEQASGPVEQVRAEVALGQPLAPVELARAAAVLAQAKLVARELQMFPGHSKWLRTKWPRALQARVLGLRPVGREQAEAVPAE